MAKIYIDTNVFLDFYQAATDRLAVFKELVMRAAKVVVTEQTVREFHRNRSLRLHDLVAKIMKDPGEAVFVTAVVREIPAFTEWTKARDEARAKAKAIADQLTKWAIDEKTDPVLAEFEKLVAAATRLPTTPDAIAKASQRKLLGDPPSSPDRHTIGDELIWETLLAGCHTDLIIVTRDRTFHNNFSVLKADFGQPGGRSLLKVTSKLREALEEVGESSKPVTDAEKEIESRPAPKVREEGDPCPKCGQRAMFEDGYDGSDGDSAWWIQCEKCGYIADSN